MTTGRINQIAILNYSRYRNGGQPSTRHAATPSTPAPTKKRTRWAWFFRDRKSKQQSRLRVSPPGLFLLTERPPAVALVLLAFHQRRPHTNTPSMLSTPAHTKCNGGSPDGVCRGNATVQSEPHLLATVITTVGSRRGRSLHHVLGLNAIHRITTQISLTTSD